MKENNNTDSKHRKNNVNESVEQTSVMVCVTKQLTCERLIHYGAQLAEGAGANLVVAHAISINDKIMGLNDEAAALDMLTQLAFEYSAEMAVFRTDDVFQGLADCAASRGVKYVILGSSPKHAEAVSNKMRALIPEANIIVVDTDGFEMQADELASKADELDNSKEVYLKEAF